MLTVSLCMIVKNEEDILRRCLDSLKGIYDEAVIVDTGSTDRTKEIALEYTDRVYDFEWIDDFAAARNFAFEKATCDYVYMADADEVLDLENHDKFLALKKILDPEVEVVQMYYVNQLQNGSVYNFDREPRAKLYKRVRHFKFIDPIHEVIRENPVVFDSDIDIIHMQKESHSKRDLMTFQKAVSRQGMLSDRLISMYARELYLAGDEDDFRKAKPFFSELSDSELTNDRLKEVSVILAKTAFYENDTTALLKYSLKDVAMEGTSEMCCILGQFFETAGDLNEAAMWYYNAAYETAPVIDLRSGKNIPLTRLSSIYESLGREDLKNHYLSELAK